MSVGALPADLSPVDEDRLLRPGRAAALLPIEAPDGKVHPERDPIVLVHGILGDPKDLQPIATRFASSSRHQIWALCYDDYHRRTSRNGDDFAAELRALADRVGAGRRLAIVAHSMGGIVARRALVALTVSAARGVERFGAVKLLGIDNPWHGYNGPSDRGFDALLVGVSRPLLPDGLEDMRARSALFAGAPGSSDPVERAGLFGADLPDHVEIELCFARDGSTVLDYTERPIADLCRALADKFSRETPVAGEPRVMNFFRAVVSSAQYFAFQADLRDRVDAHRLDAAAVRAAFERHFPRFPGDHMTVLESPALHDWIAARIA